MSEIQVPSAPSLDKVAVVAEALPVAVMPARVDSIDLLRGAVMVVMALDHTRDFFTDARFDPTDLSQTAPGMFLTRWITHFCAPVFVFLAGTGAFLAGRRRTRLQLAWFLLTRGLCLVVLEFTLVQGGWSFDPQPRIFIGQVIWATGWSMVLLAGLVWLPAWIVGLLGLVIVVMHNALDAIRPWDFGGEAWMIFKSTGFMGKWPDYGFVVSYPIVPWLGVMLLGYACGLLWLLPTPSRRRWLLALGLGATALFVLLRADNDYGDPNPWWRHSTKLFTVFSFLNCTKYPPSLDYVLMTLGPALLFLALWDRKPGPLGRVLVTFGRVPLFFYLLHVPLIHVLAIGFAYVQVGEVGFLFKHILMTDWRTLPAGYGYGLPVVYLVWLLVIALLYLPCRWFADLKRRRRDTWLSYL